MQNETPQSEYDNGLRILARWIARAHMKKLAAKQKLAANQNNTSIGTGIDQNGRVNYPETESTDKQPEKQSDEIENRGVTKDEPSKTLR